MIKNPEFNNFDPTKVGFRCGLEVHQQVLTDKKLFCRCPAGLYSDEYHAQVLRHMRPTLSELGEYDGTALMEFKTHKEIVYRLNKNSVCTYEMDDNPPFPINQDAVDIAIEIALLLNCSIVGELHIIRKQYLDGSIPAGFQRTGIVGVEGWMPFKDRRIRIIQLAIEEDACREISDHGHHRVYTTDRLAMPLIEVVTAPEILTPQESYEIGQQIGKLLRSTGKIRRGIGAVRQDVNVSVEGGTRVEIKGVPRLQYFPSLVYFEAFRQHSLLNLRDLISERGISDENIESSYFDLTDTLDNPVVNAQVQENHKIGAIRLNGLSGIFNFPIGPNRSFAHDVAGRLRVIACLTNQPILLHTDEHEQEKLSKKDLETIRSVTGYGKDDVVALVWGDEDDVKMALNEIEIRCREAAIGIPNETRQRLSSGETDFERILPGPDRMYPDTDSPPYEITRPRVRKIKDNLPELAWDREARLRNAGVPPHLAEKLSLNRYFKLYNELSVKQILQPTSLSVLLTELTIRYRRLSNAGNSLSEDEIRNLLRYYSDNDLAPEALRMLVEAAAASKKINWEVIGASLGLNRDGSTGIENIVVNTDEIGRDARTNSHQALIGFAMGKMMKTVRGKIPGSRIYDVVKSNFS